MVKVAKAAMQDKVVSIPKIQIGTFSLRVSGVSGSGLITHRFSEKAKKQMADKQQKKAIEKKEARDPDAEFKDSIYRTLDGRPGFPASAFKGAAVQACTFVEGITKVQARGAFHVLGDILPIDGDEPVMRDDIGRIGPRKDIATHIYRAFFPKWSIVLRIRYNAAILSVDQITYLFHIAGFSVGVGEWRPEKGKGGSFGMFEVAVGDNDAN